LEKSYLIEKTKLCSGTGTGGSNVMILKVFSPKNLAKMAFLIQSIYRYVCIAVFFKKNDHYNDFQ
jgi:hypothetical protein